MVSTDQTVTITRLISQFIVHVNNTAIFLNKVCPAWLFLVFRISIVLFTTFSVWVRHFHDVELVTWLILGLAMWWSIHAFSGRACLWPEERCIEREQVERHDDHFNYRPKTKDSIYTTLEDIQTALDYKSAVEISPKTLKKRPHDSFLRPERERNPSCLLSDHTVNDEIVLAQSRYNGLVKPDFECKLERLSECLLEVKQLEKSKKDLENLLDTEQDKVRSLENDNIMLRATVDIMTRQRKELVDKHVRSKQQIRQLELENRSINDKLNEPQLRCLGDFTDDCSLDVLTRKLQTSISSCKGKLSKIGLYLGNETGNNLPLKPRTTSFQI